jgi:hypothetical protein
VAIGNNASSYGAQAEYIRPKLELLTAIASTLYKRINVRTDVKPVSTRPARIPLQPLTQGGMKIGNFDGADLGLGSAPVETYGSLSCVSLLQPSQYTFLAEWANDSDVKSIQNFVTLTHEQAASVFGGFIDSLLALSDGSNTLDSVVSTTTNGLVVNNANSFQDQQPVDLWSGLASNGGTLLGSVVIQSVDSENDTIWLTGPVPAGVTAGTLILASGSSGQANSGIFGLPYWDQTGNTGNFMGIQKSAFPGKFSTPNINQGGKSMTPASMRALFAAAILAMGTENAMDGMVWHGNVEAQAAWEDIALNIQTVIWNQVKGDEAPDMLTKNAPTMIAGREFLVNIRAKPGRIDGLSLKNWSRIETRKEDYIEVEGQTAFPAYGASGGIASSVLFYLAAVLQFLTVQPRKNIYYSNYAIQPGYFGH